jgi:hypothetical protein
MYTIEITLRSNPIALSVQRKEQEGAEQLYRELFDAINGVLGGHNRLIELTCEKQEGKKVAVLANEITAIRILSQSIAKLSRFMHIVTGNSTVPPLDPEGFSGRRGG